MSELEVKKFTRKQVAQYNNQESGYYLIIHNQVYNVTEFLEDHPGGVDILIEQSGKESTKEFEEVGHSTDAIKSMSKYYVGSIIESEHLEFGKKKSKSLRSPSWLDDFKKKFFN